MTHTLHPEIEKRIKSCAKNIVWLKEYPLEDGCVEIIKFHLLPYLKMPQPIENEPLPEKDEDRFEQLQDARIGSLEWSVSKIYKLIIKLAEKQNVANDDLKQSTPQIETDRIDEAFKFYYEWENLYAFEECRDADKRIFREAILKHQPECQTCRMNKIAMKNPWKQS